MHRLRTHKLIKRFLTGSATLAVLFFASLTNADNHLMAGEGAHVVLGGEVRAVNDMSFQMDYSGGLVTVEMDHWQDFDEAKMVEPGETVTINGHIDENSHAMRTVSANSVYVTERDIRYVANDSELDGDLSWIVGASNPSLAAQGTWVGLSGKVSEIRGSQFTLDTSDSDQTDAVEVIVQTSYLRHNPLDDVGHQQIEVGDRVYVSGSLDDRFFATLEIDAFSITSVE